MRPHERLAYGKVVPSGDTWEGLYIDDHIVIQKYKKGRKYVQRPLRDENIMRDSRAHYTSLHVPVSAKKAFTFEHEFVAWGTSVCSQSGRVGTPLTKLRHLLQATAEFCSLKRCSKKVLQKLVGLYVHPFTHRRELMCVFNRVYKQIERMQDRKLSLISESSKQELCFAALLLPFAHSNIRWPLAEHVSATDATPTGAGRAEARMPPKLVELAYRYGLHRGEHVRLDWSSGRLTPSSDMLSAPAELEEALQCGRWRTTERSQFAKVGHINIQEMKVLVKELRHRACQTASGQRIVNLCDSRVVVGAFAKGRSSSVRLNQWLRRAMSHSVAGSKCLVNVWVSTKANPADYPSRGVSIPLREDLPAGLRTLLSSADQQSMLPFTSSRSVKEAPPAGMPTVQAE